MFKFQCLNMQKLKTLNLSRLNSTSVGTVFLHLQNALPSTFYFTVTFNFDLVTLKTEAFI